MKISPLFKLREKYSDEILELLNSVTLGTNGAKYKHLDTTERIKQADSPLYLSMERNNKVLGNITFCRRNEHWYIRYFAFRNFLQAGTKAKREDKGNSFLKRELTSFFKQALHGEGIDSPVKSMYAYIDPKNDRSKWMSENFGFKTVAKLTTQSFSRVKPKGSNRLFVLNEWDEIKNHVFDQFGHYNYYFDTHCSKPPFYCLKDENGGLLAYAKFTTVNWKIVRMPGKLGGIFTKIIPFVPLLRTLIQPKNHVFLVPEIVWTTGNDAQLLNELFEGVLAREKRHLILWWVDQSDPFYMDVKPKVKWGILHRMIGANAVDVVRLSQKDDYPAEKPIFVSAFDMV